VRLISASGLKIAVIMKLKSQYRRQCAHISRSADGFTLVEMMIAVALVLLIMAMFAEIFQIAAGSLSKQRGISENDQRGRFLDTMIRGDLNKRTFRDVVPFTHLKNTDLLAGGVERYSGYWYYAENDFRSDTDDVLQFTVDLENRTQEPSVSKLLGGASGISAVGISGEDTSSNIIYVPGINYTAYIPAKSHVWIGGSLDSTGTLTNNGKYTVTSCTYDSMSSVNQIFVQEAIPYSMTNHGKLFLAENEPDVADGIPGNASGSSSFAEVSYFLRGSNLCRRVLLIHDPISGSAQPHYGNGARIIPGDYTANSFWNDFDYSAFYYRGKLASSSPPLIGGGLYFHSSTESLSNTLGRSEVMLYDSLPSSGTTFLGSDQKRCVSLGMPQTRFGHDHWTGLPREFVGSGPDGFPGTADDTSFIGRYLIQECAHPLFMYPGSIVINDIQKPDQDQSPMSPKLAFTLNTSTNLVAEFTPALPAVPSRRGEDILMSNVVGFDVKIWDPAAASGAGQFVDLGGSTAVTYLNSQNPIYSPNLNQIGSNPPKLRYDTWHPEAEIIDPYDQTAAGRNSNPPFRNQNDLPLRAVQITINYRDISSNQIRQITIVHSLIDPTN
jgi:prepilin-type N-terminal cleavage/methylation domain-containing protein